MSLNLGTLLIQIGVDVKNMEKGFSALQQSIGKLGGGVAAAGAQMAGAFAAPAKQMQGFTQMASGLFVPVNTALQQTTQSATNVGNAAQTAGQHMHGAGQQAAGFAGRIGELYTKMNLLFGGMALTAAFTAPFVSFMVGAAKESISFESAFAGVRKTVEASDAEFKKLENNFRQMSLVMPITADQLARIGELAGQMGIRGVENITKFTDTIARLSVTTNMTVEDASMQMARFANIMQVPIKDVDKLGNTIVVLGNNMATTESEIMTFAMRLAGAGNVIGLTSDQVFAFGAALSSAGIHAEEGGSAMSRVFMKIAQAVKGGGEDLGKFAQVADMSAADFKKAFETDAGGAIVSFIEGLGRIKGPGADVFAVLKDLEAGDIRVMRSLLNTANAGDLLRNSLNMAAGAITNTNDLMKESEKRFGTVGSRIIMVQNNFAELRREIGDRLKPTLVWLLEATSKLITWFRELSPTVQNMALAVGAVVAAIGPLMIATSALGAAMLGLKAIFVLFGGAATATMGTVLATIGPVILAVMALAALAAYVITNWEEVEVSLINVWGGMKAGFLEIAADIGEAWNTVIYKLKSAWATFRGWFDEEVGKSLQAAADADLNYSDAVVANRRRMAQAERELMAERDKLRSQEAKFLKQWGDDWLDREAALHAEEEATARKAATATTTSFATGAKEKEKYLDAFETKFKRSEEDMLDAFKDKQAEQLAIYKEMISTSLSVMKERNDKEIANKKYALDQIVEQERTAIDIVKINEEAALQDRLDNYKIILREEEVAFKRSQEKRLDDLKDANEKELDMIRDKYDEQLKTINKDLASQMDEKKAEIDRIDAIKKEADVREKAQRTQDRINESIRETNKLAESINFGAYEKAVERAEAERKKAGDEATPELIRAERDLLDMREGLNDKAFEAYKKHKEAMLKADAKEKAATKAALDKALREVYDAMEKSAKNTMQIEKEIAKDREEESRSLLKNKLRDEIDALRDSLQNQKEFLQNAEEQELDAAKKRQAAEMERARKDIEDNVRLNKDILDKRLERKKNELKIDGEQFEEHRNLRMLEFQKQQKDELDQFEKLRKQEEENEQKRIVALAKKFQDEQEKKATQYGRDLEDLHTSFEGKLGEQQSFLDDWNRMATTIKDMQPAIAPISGYDDVMSKAREAYSLFKGLEEAVTKVGSTLNNFKPGTGVSAPSAPAQPPSTIAPPGFNFGVDAGTRPGINPPTPGPPPEAFLPLPAPLPSVPQLPTPPVWWPFPTQGPSAPMFPSVPDVPSASLGPMAAVGTAAGAKININVNGAGDPDAVASSVVRILRREGLTFA